MNGDNKDLRCLFGEFLPYHLISSTLCQCRVAEIKLEPGGEELLAYHSDNGKLVDLIEISRQDHPMVRIKLLLTFCCLNTSFQKI